MTLAYRIVIHRHDGGIDQSSIPPSLTVDDATKQNASTASYYKPAFTLAMSEVREYPASLRMDQAMSASLTFIWQP